MRTDFRDAEERLYQIAETQGGCFTAHQALEAGYSYRLQSYYRLRGKWESLDRGIFRLRHYPAAHREDLIRWSLWSHDRAGRPQIVFSHETALAFHDIGDFNPARYHFIASAGFRKPVPPGCVVHRGDLPWEEAERHEGFWVTTPLRSLVDGAFGHLEMDHMQRAIMDAVARGLVVISDLEPRLPRDLRNVYLALVREHSGLVGAVR